MKNVPMALLLMVASSAFGQSGKWIVLTNSLFHGSNYIPYGISIDKEGNLFVSYIENSEGGLIVKRDLQGGWSILAAQGTGIGQVWEPTGLAVDDLDNLFVEDVGRIEERNILGNWTALQNSFQISYPFGIAVDGNNNVYVSGLDNNNSIIEKRDSHGNWTILENYIPSYQLDTPAGYFNNPEGITVDGIGNIYISDSGNNRIQEMDTNGEWKIIASFGSDVGQFYHPCAIAVDSFGKLYVTERGNNRIQMRDTDGNWTIIATPDLFDPTSNSISANPGQVFNPEGITVDTFGNLYVADTGNNRIQEYQVSTSALPGDLNGDGKVTIADAVLGLWIRRGSWLPHSRPTPSRRPIGHRPNHPRRRGEDPGAGDRSDQSDLRGAIYEERSGALLSTHCHLARRGGNGKSFEIRLSDMNISLRAFHGTTTIFHETLKVIGCHARMVRPKRKRNVEALPREGFEDSRFVPFESESN